MNDRATSRGIATALMSRRDNDLTVTINGRYVPVTGVAYVPDDDRLVLTLDLDKLDFVLECHTRDLDAAMYSAWRRGDWYKTTDQASFEECEAAAAAVRRHHDRLVGEDEDPEPLDEHRLRWWRYNDHKVDTLRVVVGAVVDLASGSDIEIGFVVHRMDSPTMGVVLDHAGQKHLFSTENVVLVQSSPADEPEDDGDASLDTSRKEVGREQQ